LDIPAGKYRVDWTDVLTGKTRKSETFKYLDGEAFIFPGYTGEIALRLVRR
jgi:hypothetical protein